MLRQILSAVDFMHARGIIHRDLKPENLLLKHKAPKSGLFGRAAGGPSGTEPIVKIIDFGLSKMFDDDDDAEGAPPTNPAAQKAGSFLGTRGYLAPELLKRRECVCASRQTRESRRAGRPISRRI